MFGQLFSKKLLTIYFQNNWMHIIMRAKNIRTPVLRVIPSPNIVLVRSANDIMPIENAINLPGQIAPS